MTLALSAAAFGIGAVGWTLAEYLLHRFVGHARRSRFRFTLDHRRHHRELTWFTPNVRKALTACVVAAGGSALLWPLLGVTGLAAVAGFIAAYLGYEVLHRRLHTHPPLNAWGRWARKNHWYHHAVDPYANHGVTVGIWDRVFGTATRERVRVHVSRAPAWLLADPERYAADFELVGEAA